MSGIIFPDLALWALPYLRTALAARPESYATSVTVSNRIPTEQPGDAWPTSKRLVVVRDDGGPALGDVRAVARIGVQVWGATEAETSNLSNLVAALVAASEGNGPVRRATISRPYSVTEASSRPKRYLTAELVIRGIGL